MVFVITYRQSCRANQSTIGLHAEGCQDIAKEIEQAGAATTKIQAPNVDKALEFVIKDLENGGFEKGSWTKKDIDVLSCCKKHKIAKSRKGGNTMAHKISAYDKARKVCKAKGIVTGQKTTKKSLIASLVRSKDPELKKLGQEMKAE